MDDLCCAFRELANRLRSTLSRAKEQSNWLCLLQFYSNGIYLERGLPGYFKVHGNFTVGDLSRKIPNLECVWNIFPIQHEEWNQKLLIWSTKWRWRMLHMLSTSAVGHRFWWNFNRSCKMSQILHKKNFRSILPIVFALNMHKCIFWVLLLQKQY